MKKIIKYGALCSFMMATLMAPFQANAIETTLGNNPDTTS